MTAFWLPIILVLGGDACGGQLWPPGSLEANQTTGEGLPDCRFDGCRGFSAINGSSATLPIGCFLQAMGVRNIHIGGLVRTFIHKRKKGTGTTALSISHLVPSDLLFLLFFLDLLHFLSFFLARASAFQVAVEQ